MSEKTLISVIVPVYNVEKYLDKCISSIVGQTYKNLEIILVDDGSTDRCPEICDKWARDDSRIKVVHKKNGGLSDARNAGLAVFKGELVSFIDSDDFLHKDFYNVLISAISENDCDIAECNFIKFADGKEPDIEKSDISVCVFDANDAMKKLVEDSLINQVVWNKIYKKRAVLGKMFEVGKCNEDEFWTYRVVGDSSGLVHVNYCGYYYLQRCGSIMGNSYSLRRLDAVQAKILRHEYITEKFPSLSSASRINLWNTCMYQGQMSLKYLSKAERKTAFSCLSDAVKKFPLTIRDKRSLAFTHKCWAALTDISLKAVCRLRNLLKVGV